MQRDTNYVRVSYFGMIRRSIFDIYHITKFIHVRYHIISYFRHTHTHSSCFIFDSYDGYYDDVSILYDDYDYDDEYGVDLFFYHYYYSFFP